MAHMIRKQVYLEPRQARLLKQRSKALGVTEAALIRQIIDRTLLTAHGSGPWRPEAWEDEKRFIKHLLAKGPVPGERRWTRDELYDDRALVA